LTTGPGRIWFEPDAPALIPKYAPQWTDHKPEAISASRLIELFAWLAEGHHLPP